MDHQCLHSARDAWWAVPMNRLGLCLFLMSLKCLLVYNLLATFSESLLAEKKKSYFSDKSRQKFGQVLSVLVLKYKANVIVCGKVNVLEGLHAKIMDSYTAGDT